MSQKQPDSDEVEDGVNSLKTSKTIINLKEHHPQEEAACMDSISQPRHSSPRPTKTNVSSKSNNNETTTITTSQPEQISTATTNSSFTDSRKTTSPESSSSPLRQG